MLWGLLVEFRLKGLCLELTSGAVWGRGSPRAVPGAAQQHSGHLGLLWPQEEKGSVGKLLMGEPTSNEEREGMELVLPLSSSPPPVPTSPFDGDTEKN